MQYIVDSDKPVEQAAADLERAVQRHGFGVLNVHDLRATLAGKGHELGTDCRILDVCNPAQALEVLSADMGMSLALPCRVAVYAERGRTRIGMIRPSGLLSALSDDARLASVAEEVEQSMIAMIEEAR